jgi:hypothetical protein
LPDSGLKTGADIASIAQWVSGKVSGESTLSGAPVALINTPPA